ncbi:hypothetical protein KAM448_40440 [Aeromonas caviae]|uniref:Uncharacterized protein n=1 Tax=Aeromonas caviae TaxID=648 RepID=A0ABD0BFN2_AERCA|nr:hypothetical protein KAM355_41360 [Aeromonas caviae]GJB13667.1 hypothetical protein KAM362_42270 [Aeromonas caviae]GJB26374.1 hypothetical protein KAM365_41240 [Aeromonas caviae]GJB35022.1 hypothetical protein KAM367_41240 [Aeromonas caviae]GJB61622.1 hypothetical protein KAM374_41580 [Aeromonas caviae]
MCECINNDAAIRNKTRVPFPVLGGGAGAPTSIRLDKKPQTRKNKNHRPNTFGFSMNSLLSEVGFEYFGDVNAICIAKIKMIRMKAKIKLLKMLGSLEYKCISILSKIPFEYHSWNLFALLIFPGEKIRTNHPNRPPKKPDAYM